MRTILTTTASAKFKEIEGEPKELETLLEEQDDTNGDTPSGNTPNDRQGDGESVEQV